MFLREQGYLKRGGKSFGEELGTSKETMIGLAES